MLHIGIVACSTEGAALCYRTVSLEGAKMFGEHDHPEVSLHSHSLAKYMRFVRANDWAGVAELMLSSAEKLASSSALTIQFIRLSIWLSIARLGHGCTSQGKLRKRRTRADSTDSPFSEHVT
jgi:hypothetical protein